MGFVVATSREACDSIASDAKLSAANQNVMQKQLFLSNGNLVVHCMFICFPFVFLTSPGFLLWRWVEVNHPWICRVAGRGVFPGHGMSAGRRGMGDRRARRSCLNCQPARWTLRHQGGLRGAFLNQNGHVSFPLRVVCRKCWNEGNEALVDLWEQWKIVFALFVLESFAIWAVHRNAVMKVVLPISWTSKTEEMYIGFKGRWYHDWAVVVFWASTVHLFKLYANVIVLKIVGIGNKSWAQEIVTVELVIFLPWQVGCSNLCIYKL